MPWRPESGTGASKLHAVKYTVSYGGIFAKFLADSSIRYIGGCNRIVKLNRHISYRDLASKLCEVSGCSDWKLRIKLPTVKGMALKDVNCDDDLKNVLEKFDTASAFRSGDPPRLRVFVIPNELPAGSKQNCSSKASPTASLPHSSDELFSTLSFRNKFVESFLSKCSASTRSPKGNTGLCDPRCQTK